MTNQARRENWAQIGRSAGRLTAGAAALLSLAMMTGCPKPPPPPPPEPEYIPPPPAPTEVSLNDLLQEMKTDPRVQFASDITLYDETFARSIIDLADAIAKGDDDKLRAMLDAGAGGHLVSLVDTGEWSEATEPIEAVRIVYAGPYEGSMSLQSAVAGMGQAMSQMMEVIKQGLAAGGGEGIFEEIAKQMGDQIPPEQIEEARKKYMEMANLKPEEFIAKLQEEMAKVTADMPDMPAIDPSTFAGAAASHGVLLAVQDSRGAYLLGWGASNTGEKWVFSNAPSAQGERPRAAAWDGIGAMGFQYATFSAGSVFEDLFLDAAAAPGAGGSPGSDTPGSPSSEPASEPGRKNTPSGPINVPGGA